MHPNGRPLPVSELRSETVAKVERRWGVVAGGCHPNRRTLETIETAGFEVVDLEQGELQGLPRLVQPYVLGTAIRKPPGAVTYRG